MAVDRHGRDVLSIWSAIGIDPHHRERDDFVQTCAASQRSHANVAGGSVRNHFPSRYWEPNLPRESQSLCDLGSQLVTCSRQQGTRDSFSSLYSFWPLDDQRLCRTAQRQCCVVLNNSPDVPLKDMDPAGLPTALCNAPNSAHRRVWAEPRFLKGATVPRLFMRSRRMSPR